MSERINHPDLLLRVRNVEAMLRRAERTEAVGNKIQAEYWLDQAVDRYETLPPFLQKRVKW